MLLDHAERGVARVGCSRAFFILSDPIGDSQVATYTHQ